MFTKTKRLLIFILVFFMLFCYSCSKNEESVDDNKEYVVTYNLMGGMYEDATSYQIIVKNGNLVEDITPVKDGYSFVGWTTRLTETLNVDFDLNQKITSNTVLYAVWRRPQITFELDGGYFGMYNHVSDLIDAFLNDFSGYMGWPIDEYGFFDSSYGRGIEFFKNSNYGEKWTPLLEYLKTKSNNPGYLSSFINSNRDHNSSTSPYVRAEITGFLKQTQDERKSWPQVTSGAYHDPSVIEDIWQYFKGDSINFYNANEDYILPTPHKTGSYFLGWYDNPEFNGEKITYIPKGSVDNKTYYAKWQDSIKIKYVSNVVQEYNNKQELFTAFFTEYYNFLNSKEPNQALIDNDINTLEDFLNVALDYNYGKGQMRGLADIISGTFLDIEIGGKIEDQSTDKFIGYCYHNNLFREFIEFDMMFFSYWREDEGYTTPTNNGSDFFASSWAALVDTCKFFYYDHTTSYVKTTRVANCFKYIPGVAPNFHLTKNYIGEDLATLNIIYAGYKFDGFYMDENYTISANEYLKTCTDKEVTIYIKFVKE